MVVRRYPLERLRLQYQRPQPAEHQQPAIRPRHPHAASRPPSGGGRHPCSSLVWSIAYPWAHRRTAVASQHHDPRPPRRLAVPATAVRDRNRQHQHPRSAPRAHRSAATAVLPVARRRPPHRTRPDPLRGDDHPIRVLSAFDLRLPVRGAISRSRYRSVTPSARPSSYPDADYHKNATRPTRALGGPCTDLARNDEVEGYPRLAGDHLADDHRRLAGLQPTNGPPPMQEAFVETVPRRCGGRRSPILLDSRRSSSSSSVRRLSVHPLRCSASACGCGGTVPRADRPSRLARFLFEVTLISARTSFRHDDGPQVIGREVCRLGRCPHSMGVPANEGGQLVQAPSYPYRVGRPAQGRQSPRHRRCRRRPRRRALRRDRAPEAKKSTSGAAVVPDPGASRGHADAHTPVVHRGGPARPRSAVPVSTPCPASSGRAARSRLDESVHEVRISQPPTPPRAAGTSRCS